MDAVFEMWKEPCVARCIGKPCASGMVGTEAGVVCVYIVGVEWFSFCQMPITAPFQDDTERNRECEVW